MLLHTLFNRCNINMLNKILTINNINILFIKNKLLVLNTVIRMNLLCGYFCMCFIIYNQTGSSA